MFVLVFGFCGENDAMVLKVYLVVVQHHHCTKAHSVVSFKKVNFTLCGFHFNKKKIILLLIFSLVKWKVQKCIIS